MTKLFIKDGDGAEDVLECDNFTWNQDTFVLSLYQVLEEGEYKPGTVPGMLDVVKQPETRLIGVYVKPILWKIVEEEE